MNGWVYELYNRLEVVKCVFVLCFLVLGEILPNTLCFEWLSNTLVSNILGKIVIYSLVATAGIMHL